MSKEFSIKDLVIDDEYGIIDSNASVQEAAKKMKELGVPDLVVVENETKVLGVVADFDIVQNIIAEGKDAQTEKVIAAMYSITPVKLETPVIEAFTKMQDLNVNVIPVVSTENKLLGVASIHDCWSYIPDENTDEIGLIPVSDPKNAEFWFASVCSITAFVLGILLPLTGIVGYFSGNLSNLKDLFTMDRSGAITFYLFQVNGTDFYSPISNLIAANGVIWLLLVICGFLVLISGILGLFSLFYSSFSDIRNIQTSPIVRMILPGSVIIFMILEWILYYVALAGLTVTIDGTGLIITIISIVLILAAINRNMIFKSSGEEAVKDEGTS
ncbi:MAG: CBS domain-containing protein [archaeon]|nr:CBS domain-containing protein [archaeon]